MDEETEYRQLLSDMDAAQAAVERARERVAAARAEMDVATRHHDEVEARASELWTMLGRGIGPRRRRLGPVPEPDRQTFADPDVGAVNVSGLLDEVAADIGEPSTVGVLRRFGRVLQLPLAGALCGAAGFGAFWWWLREFGVTLFGVLGVAGLVLGPPAGMVVGVWLRQRYADEPSEQPEPWAVVLALAPALAAEATLYLLTR